MEQCILIAAAFLKRTKRDGAAREGGKGGEGEGGTEPSTPPATPLTPSAGIEGRVWPGELEPEQEMSPLQQGGSPWPCLGDIGKGSGTHG